MEGIEKQIETSALRLSDLKPGFDRQEEEYYQSNKVKIYDLVKQVIKSDLSKQYWQQGLYTEEEVKRLITQSHIDRTKNPMLVGWDNKGLIFEPNWFKNNLKK